jgi:hypothetical protein
MDFGLLTCCALSNRNVYMLKAALLIWPWLLVKTGNELRHATVLCPLLGSPLMASSCCSRPCSSGACLTWTARGDSRNGQVANPPERDGLALIQRARDVWGRGSGGYVARDISFIVGRGEWAVVTAGEGRRRQVHITTKIVGRLTKKPSPFISFDTKPPIRINSVTRSTCWPS